MLSQDQFPLPNPDTLIINLKCILHTHPYNVHTPLSVSHAHQLAIVEGLGNGSQVPWFVLPGKVTTRHADVTGLCVTVKVTVYWGCVAVTRVYCWEEGGKGRMSASDSSVRDQGHLSLLLERKVSVMAIWLAAREARSGPALSRRPNLQRTSPLPAECDVTMTQCTRGSRRTS